MYFDFLQSPKGKKQAFPPERVWGGTNLSVGSAGGEPFSPACTSSVMSTSEGVAGFTPRYSPGKLGKCSHISQGKALILRHWAVSTPEKDHLAFCLVICQLFLFFHARQCSFYSCFLFIHLRHMEQERGYISSSISLHIRRQSYEMTVLARIFLIKELFFSRGKQESHWSSISFLILMINHIS